MRKRITGTKLGMICAIIVGVAFLCHSIWQMHHGSELNDGVDKKIHRDALGVCACMHGPMLKVSDFDFPERQGSREYELTVLFIDEPMSSEEIISVMKKQGLAAADLADLGYYISDNGPYLDRFNIAQLGTVHGKGTRLFLWNRGTEERFLLYEEECMDWSPRCGFLARRPITAD